MEQIISYVIWAGVILVGYRLISQWVKDKIKPNYTAELRGKKRTLKEFLEDALDTENKNHPLKSYDLKGYDKKIKKNIRLIVIFFIVSQFLWPLISNILDKKNHSRKSDHYQQSKRNEQRTKRIREKNRKMRLDAIERRKKMLYQKSHTKNYDFSPGNKLNCPIGRCLVRQVVWENSKGCGSGKKIYDKLKCASWACKRLSSQRDDQQCLKGHAGVSIIRLYPSTEIQN